jgi:lipopolysaccharide/colanic/teichoic acid biosynthesis glycosyltransferase
MNLIVVHKNSPDDGGESLLRFALDCELVAGVILDGLGGRSLCGRERASILRSSEARDFGETVCAVPEEWAIKQHQSRRLRPSGSDVRPDVIYYKDDVPVGSELMHRAGWGRTADSWFVVSNGRFATRINIELLERVLAGVEVDVVAVNAEPDLLAERERMRMTTRGEVAGLRRVYSDSAEFALISTDWPHHLLIRIGVLDQVLAGGALPQSFSALSERCRSEALRLRAINVAGTVFDLETQDGLLSFCRAELLRSRNSRPDIRGGNTISPDSRLFGKVLLGKNTRIGSDAVIVGPAIIGDDVKIESGVVIDSSIIGPGVRVPRNRLVRNCIVKDPQHDWKRPARTKSNYREHTSYPMYDLSLLQSAHGPFRSWPRFSYAGSLKRIADCLAAMVVLILFAPLLPCVALAIKLNSPGPVFYRDKRQGLHGKAFGCLKFRTMVTGAHEIQEKLRVVSQVDGPQFKMEDDPRISTVGRFLRETYIDEIPQFFNVLLGQMSIVGPRPSPEAENTLCPFWRDARLSVRPGITGLWQLYRTRQPMKDFQEWIHYDTEYVRNLSLKMDLRTCWQTARKLFDNFISQF